MRKIKLIIIPIVFIMISIILKFNLKGILNGMPSCVYYDKWGIYCVGCGNTRALRALLNGDILLSLRCNPIIVTILILGIIHYLELLLNKKLLPKNKIFWAVIIILFILYYIIRNFIFCFNIPIF